MGLVTNLNRPGANLTGSAILQAELAAKQLQLLHELIPNAALFGALADPASPTTQFIITDLQAAAPTLGLQLLVVNAGTDNDLELTFASFSQQRVGSVLVGSSAFFNRRTEQLAALAARRALPAICPFREFALSGGLMSYGSSLGYGFRQVGIYAGRILKGEKPADLPVVQASKLELVINLKTAKALGLTIPETLLATADEVIRCGDGSSSRGSGARRRGRWWHGGSRATAWKTPRRSMARYCNRSKSLSPVQKSDLDDCGIATLKPTKSWALFSAQMASSSGTCTRRQRCAPS